MKMSEFLFIMFMGQLLIELALKFSWFGMTYIDTTPMHEDLITTLLFCTWAVVETIERG